MTQTQHPLAEIAQLAQADGSFPFTLLVDDSVGLTRLQCLDPSIWVMCKSEDGSMRDRWKLDEGAQFVRLNKAQIAKGAAQNWEDLRALAERLKTGSPEHPFFALYDQARSEGKDNITIRHLPDQNYTALVFADPDVLVKYAPDPNSNIDRIGYNHHKRIELSEADLSKSPITQLRELRKRIADLHDNR